MGLLWQKFIESLSPRQVCWLCLAFAGTIGIYGARTYAGNEQVSAKFATLKEEIREIRIEQLSKAVFELREKQCAGVRAQTPIVAYTKLLTEAMEKYREKVGREYTLPGCNEL